MDINRAVNSTRASTSTFSESAKASETLRIYSLSRQSDESKKIGEREIPVIWSRRLLSVLAAKKQERNQPSLFLFLLVSSWGYLSRIFYPDLPWPSASCPLFSLTDSPAISSILSTLFFLVLRGSSIDEFRREERPEQGQTEEYVFGEGEGARKAGDDEERRQERNRREIDKREGKVYDTAEGVERRRTRERSDGSGGGGGEPASRCALNPSRYRAKRPTHPTRQPPLSRWFRGARIPRM